MTFHKVRQPDIHSLFSRVSDDGRIAVCVTPVMYGFRIRAGYAGSMCYELDYCAGDKPKAVEEIYYMVICILIKHNGDFSVFPRQRTKPMYNDPECAAKLFELSKGVEFEPLNFSSLPIKKALYLQALLA